MNASHHDQPVHDVESVRRERRNARLMALAFALYALLQLLLFRWPSQGRSVVAPGTEQGRPVSVPHEVVVPRPVAAVE